VSDSGPESDAPSEPAHDPRFERRRHPRQTISHGAATLPLLMNADVLDISLSGALLRCESPLAIGHRAQLRTLLEGMPFLAWVSVVRVRRERSHGSGEAVRAGVAFTSLDARSTRQVRGFMKD
jgi:hypothetical protein